jgi:hypothetical protein
MTKPSTLAITEFTLHDFMDKFQAAILEGYRLNLNKNETFPQRFGALLEVILELPEEKAEEVQQEDSLLAMPLGSLLEALKGGVPEVDTQVATEEEIPVETAVAPPKVPPRAGRPAKTKG